MRSPAPTPAEARIDLHLHSRASTDTGSWFLNRAYMPESYTEPEAAYATAKARGMNLVALTDHNTISGALEIAHHPDVVVGVEVTATFPEDRVPVHVLDRERKLAYHGRIDDNHRDLSRVTSHDLRNALDALLAGNAPPVTLTTAFGCSIKWK